MQPAKQAKINKKKIQGKVSTIQRDVYPPRCRGGMRFHDSKQGKQNKYRQNKSGEMMNKKPSSCLPTWPEKREEG
jgi:hypothetical protein